MLVGSVIAAVCDMYAKTESAGYSEVEEICR